MSLRGSVGDIRVSPCGDHATLSVADQSSMTLTFTPSIPRGTTHAQLRQQSLDAPIKPLGVF